MPESKRELRVYRESWKPEHLALLCGIANAGGGSLVISSTDTGRARRLKRMRKPFEQIPVIARRELGLACTTQPVLDGASLCLEIEVPAAPLDSPVRYAGSCRFYDREESRNLSLSSSEIIRRRKEAEGVATTVEERASANVMTTHEAYEETSRLEDAVATAEPSSTEDDAEPLRIKEMHQALSELAEQLSQHDGDAGASNGNAEPSFDKPQRTNTAEERKVKASGKAAAARDGEVSRVKVHEVDPKASTFEERSIAAANKLNLTSTTEYVLRVLHTNGRATAPRIAEVLGVSESTVRRSFKQLRDLNLIERVGSDKAGYWRVTL